ncbi:hypothetical protein OsJ_33596 [Oryza sativa Japonica Group]|uniref:Uncharacterized protein n=1 Tax=Oryza sativa subsp. japonica TaxID=39947 RepID=A3CAD7_ORYSJ|nr:hypothetical protein OsJ_33596 [Oryza sativa Japonica Group]
MGFCTVQSPIDGIFVLTMASSDGHQYLTDEAIGDLIASLTAVRDTPGLRGLVTTSRLGSFCDGVDHDAARQPDEQVAARVGEVVRLLLEMPAPTAAAVNGDATSLGLALALAHDHCVVWEAPRWRSRRPGAGANSRAYVPALLRDRVALARLRNLLILRPEAFHGKGPRGHFGLRQRTPPAPTGRWWRRRLASCSKGSSEKEKEKHGASDQYQIKQTKIM